MTALENFEKLQPKLIENLEAGFLKLINEKPQVFCEWLGMSMPVVALDPADEDYMKEISGV